MRLIDADKLIKDIEDGKKNVIDQSNNVGLSSLNPILLGYYAYFEEMIKSAKTIMNK